LPDRLGASQRAGTVPHVTERSKKDRDGQTRWYAIGFSSVLMFFSYVLIVYALTAAANDETTFAGGVIGVAIGLVPAVFFVASTVSNRVRPMRATVLAVLLWIAVAGALAFVDIPTALVAGFGAGGIVAFRRSSHATVASRSIAVAGCALYVLILQWLFAPAGLMVGSVLPFLAIGVTDRIREREALAELEGAATP
jgi:hypothetical protein